MNYLGHFILSHPDEELVVGNFIADFVKGNKYTGFPERIAHGILMHRFIDEFTDSHPSSVACRELLRPAVGKLSGVALDIIYDHIIASDFHLYVSEPLPQFAESVYNILSNNKKHMGLKGKYVLHYMCKHNWFCRYDNAQGIQTTLMNMSKRIKFNNNLPLSYDIFREHQELMKSMFKDFFTSLCSEVTAKYLSNQ